MTGKDFGGVFMQVVYADFGTVDSTTNKPPVKRKNEEVRAREYLTKDEVNAMLEAAKSTGRYPLRDGLLILLGYRHGLRVAELVGMTWQQIDLKTGLMHVKRKKNGTPSTHPLSATELKELKKLQKQSSSPFVFDGERGPLSQRGAFKIIARAGELAKLAFPVHPHMLRHGAGFQLANKGMDTRAIQHYLGHRNINNTVRYTQLSAERFKDVVDIL
jgi:integrase